MKDVTESVFKSKRKVLNVSLSKRWKIALYVLLVVALAIYYYVFLPPIHYADIGFWFFVGLAGAGVLFIQMIADSVDTVTLRALPRLNWKYKTILGLGTLVTVVWLITHLIVSPLFFAKPFSNLIQIETADFEKDFAPTDTTQIPLIDRETAVRLGDRKIGALANLVSQFETADDYTQINIQGKPYRVTPLEYAGFFKWLNNFSTGIPHYLKVNMVTGDVTVETPEQPIKYSQSDLFNRDMMRRLRFSYPFVMFGEPTFEVDDAGNPYYIASTYGRHFFLSEPEVNGLVTLNAMTGETQHYALDDIPTWVDRVYSADLIMHQLKLNGQYKKGFWNSILAKEGVTEPTEGYNYLPLNDDIYLYTGITSVASDESNIGFVLVNMRTKEAKMFPVTAAEEFSAMDSAQGSVQEKGYKATFPLLINVKGNPMYILSLKDSSGLVKSYALIDVQNYQRVYIDSNVERLMAQYLSDNQLDVTEVTQEETLRTLTGQIDQIQATVVGGNTVYYFMMNGDVYRASIELSDRLPFATQGQAIKIQVNDFGVVRQIEWKEE